MKRHTIFAVSALTALSALAWGQKGHDVTAAIAEAHLTPATKVAIDSMLGGKSIVYWSNWLDNASHTPRYSYSKTWHYKNIDEGVNFDDAPIHAEGDIITALKAQQAVAADPKASCEDKELAIKMIVHLMGDLHQPMHLGHLSDLGGNRTDVMFFDTPTNLHSVWDTSLPEAAHRWSHTEWREQLDRLPDSEIYDIQGGAEEDWAKETYRICSDIYTHTKPGTKISYDYIAEWTPVVETQFLRGGLRLAHVLNSIFDANYRRRNPSSVK